MQSSWVWIPPHYVFTPGGYLFVEGYWDLPLTNRGILFAPVYYPQPVYLQPAYVFTPSITIATPGLVANLFVQPGYGHYCFGDYYDRSFISVGIFPWFSFSYVSGPSRPVFYDPIFSFYASINISRDPGWVTRVRQEYIVRRDNVAMRPPRTFVEQTRIIERNGERPSNLVMARPIHELASHPEAAGGMRLERLERRVAAAVARARCAAYSVPRPADAARTAGSEVARSRRSARGAGQALAARPRPLSLPASPVSAAIHHHAASGEPIGPTGHSEHQASMREPTEHAGPRYEQREGVASSSPRRARPGHR